MQVFHSYAWNKPCLQGIQCCSYSAVTIHAAYNAICNVKSTVLYFYISTLQSMCAVSNMAVFCSSLISCFPRMLLRYFMNDFEMVPVAPISNGIISVFTFHMRCIYIVRSYVLEFSRLLSWSHFCLLNLQHLLTHTCLFHYHKLWYPVY